MIYIGIDPDIDKSGVAIYETESKKTNLHNWTLPQIVSYINRTKKYPNTKFLFIIEKGEGNKSIFHKAKNKKIAGAIGINVGKNFAVTKIIADFCENMEVNFEYFVPNGKTPKYNHNTARALFNLADNRTNQEQRDALRCIQKYFKTC